MHTRRYIPPRRRCGLSQSGRSAPGEDLKERRSNPLNPLNSGIVFPWCTQAGPPHNCVSEVTGGEPVGASTATAHEVRGLQCRLACNPLAEICGLEESGTNIGLFLPLPWF